MVCTDGSGSFRSSLCFKYCLTATDLTLPASGISLSGRASVSALGMCYICPACLVERELLLTFNLYRVHGCHTARARFWNVTIRWLCRPPREPSAGVDLARRADQRYPPPPSAFVSGPFVHRPKVLIKPIRHSAAQPTACQQCRGQERDQCWICSMLAGVLHQVYFFTLWFSILHAAECSSLQTQPTLLFWSLLIDFHSMLNCGDLSFLNYLDDASEPLGQRRY